MFSTCQDVRRHGDRLFCFLFVASACDGFYYSHVLERYLYSHPPAKLPRMCLLQTLNGDTPQSHFFLFLYFLELLKDVSEMKTRPMLVISEIYLK